MKPLQLEISAFGPYQNKVMVDFQLLEDGLFLITGPTGGGKTTLFDAIIFALFGEASGSSREAKTLRCDFASDKVETYVDLTFELHHQIYRILRKPQYLKKGRKSPVPSSVDFLLPDGKHITNSKEVSQKMNDLLGVDVHQFKQIAMIAQGEFTKLIFASSDEKEKIFRKLFGTKKYEDFEFALKERYLHLKNKMDTTMIQIQTLQNQMDYPPQANTKSYIEYVDDQIHQQKEALDQQNEQIQNLLKKVNQIKEQLQKDQLHNQNLKKYQALQLEQSALSKKHEEMKQLENDLLYLIQIESFCYQEKEIVDLENQIKQLAKKKQEVYNQFQEILKREKQQELETRTLPLLQTKVQNLLLEKQTQETSLEEIKIYEKVKQEAQKNSLTLKNQERERDELKGLLEQKTLTLNHYQQAKSKEATLQKEYFYVKEQIRQDEELLKQIQQFHEMKEKEKKLQQQEQLALQTYQTHFQQFQVDQQNLLKEENQFLLAQAGYLAQDLKEQEPCPVCGSYHHPHLASLQASSLTKETLDRHKRANENKRNLYLQDHQTLLKVQQEMKFNQQQLNLYNFEQDVHLLEQATRTNQENRLIQCQEIEEELHSLKLLDVKKQELEIDLQKLQTKFDQKTSFLQQTKDTLTKLNSQLELYTYDEHSLETITIKQKETLLKIKQIQAQIAKIQEEQSKLQEQKANLSGSLKMYDEEYEQTLNRHDLMKAKFKKALNKIMSEESYAFYKIKLEHKEEYQQALNHYQMQVQTNLALLNQTKKDLHHFDLIDLTKYQFQIQKLEKDYELKQKNYQDAYSHYKQNDQLLKKIEKSYQTIQNSEEDYYRYYDLYQTTTGNNSKKLSFERYILAVYFEQILQNANVRFKQMTDSRYEMMRKEEKSSRQSGLDIVVQDYESGTIRDIKTLSGGETFKAALSLALGLSDMIQSEQGGIELNTLFIDEGFGSLDSESLSQALNVLLQLQDHSKMIGIISHVQELQEQIDHQIIIKKDPVGSHIEIK